MPVIADANEREQALDLTQSFIVQAPAGSGKTELLIQRFLGLLGAVQHPEQILAVTFTRKAAGEMKSRIIAALHTAEIPTPPESDHERKTWQLAKAALAQNSRENWSLLENPARLKIQTIDSFCAGLTQQMPILSKTGGGLSIQENAQSLYAETAQRILALVEEESPAGESARVILSHLDNLKSSFLKRIIQLLEKRDQWIIDFFDEFQVPETLRTGQENVLAGLIENILHDAHDLFPSQATDIFLPLAVYSSHFLAKDNPGHKNVCLQYLTNALPDPSARNLNQWRALADLLLTSAGDLRKKIDVRMGFPTGKAGSEAQNRKEAFYKLIEILTPETELLELLRDIQKLPDPEFTDDEWTVLYATLNLLPEISTTLRKIFIEQQKTDFTEISLAASNALGEDLNPTDLLLYLDTKIKHILLDEYQDTSVKQHRLLKLLTAGWEPEDGRSLFIVGDPMQSIYRFRDAEVGIFLRTQREGLENIPLTSLKLTTNFRSKKNFVDWVNICFKKVFPNFNDEDLGAVSYSPSSADPSKKPDPEPGTVLHPISMPDGTNSEDQAEEEARQITDLIQSIQKKDSEKTIAILVRARTHLHAIVRNFQTSSIAFKSEDIDPLTSRPAIQDLLALMRALLSEWDRIAWLSILRAPWCGLSLKDIHRLCELDNTSAIWNLLNETKRVSKLSPIGQTRVGNFVKRIGPALKVFPSANFRDLLEGCWIQLGGPVCVDDTTKEDVEVFFDEVTNTLENGGILMLENFNRVLDSLYASPTIKEDNPVQIMTMHKAKGLEFDTVILPGLGRTSKREEKRLAFWMAHGDNILIAPIEEIGEKNSRIYDFLARLDRRKDEFESMRLLYVAATRTKKQLHLFGHIKKNKNIYAPEKNSLLDKLWPHIREDWLNGFDPELEKQITESIAVDDKMHITCRLPAVFQAPDPLPDIDTGPTIEIKEETDLYPEYVWAGNEARFLGNVLHACFKTITDQGLERWRSTSHNELETHLKIALLAEGLSPARIQSTIQTGMKAVNNIIEDETGRWILTNHEDANSEYPLTGFIKYLYINKVLDRTFIDEEGIRWIIDYKTGEHQGADLEFYFQEEAKRYKSQLDQYEHLFKLKGETRPIKKGLYYPLHKRLIEIK
jgi:ATP-dependent helicase/nuclease subunit A